MSSPWQLGLHLAGGFWETELEHTSEFSCPNWGLTHHICIPLNRGLFPEAFVLDHFRLCPTMAHRACTYWKEATLSVRVSADKTEGRPWQHLYNHWPSNLPQPCRSCRYPESTFQCIDLSEFRAQPKPHLLQEVPPPHHPRVGNLPLLSEHLLPPTSANLIAQDSGISQRRTWPSSNGEHSSFHHLVVYLPVPD